ncbi:hypothetical protein CR105_01140 [Massilia eurypsychrophila]|uniref:DUF3667 domain-containing protein n=1 Tax=Massilia eurypsychrophila TaxID=1485217 RepID=A0A2G8TLC4_9BURK|nr:DUF3667 domain-containing protein [Massilia eurypsychrophila]PIL46789.1 hypothetical protein CR105_01140 [Massilia eurypsychrophila]
MQLEFEPAGALVTATLAAGEIEREGAAIAGKPAHGNCANCQTALTGSFCHACGQRDHVHRSLLHLGEEFLHGLLHFDTKAWHTLPLLVAKPGKLTRDYVQGKRTRYVSPLALFLFMVFFMFFVVSSLSNSTMNGVPAEVSGATAGLEKDIFKAKAKLAKAEAKLAAAREQGDNAGAAQADADKARSELGEEETALHAINAAIAGTEDVRAGATHVHKSETKVDTGHPKLDATIRQAIKNPEFTIYKIRNAASKFSFLLVPISLPFLWLMFFWKRGVTMYDHAVFALYSLSFMALLVVTLTLLQKTGMNSLVATLAFAVPPLHMFLQLRGAYSLGFGSTLWRTVALLCVSATVLVMYLLLILYLSVA